MIEDILEDFHVKDILAIVAVHEHVVAIVDGEGVEYHPESVKAARALIVTVALLESRM